MRFTEINIKEDIKISEYYNKKISISDKDGKPLRFQIPRMYMPFGLSGFTPEIGQTKWNIDLSMKGWNEEDNYIKRFYEFLRNVEKHIISFIDENSVEIFGKKHECIESIFNSNIKEDFNRDPKFRVKVDTDYNNNIKPHIYDINEKDITTNAKNGLYSKNSCVALVELNSVYFLNKKFGFTWKLCQMKVFEAQRLHGFQFNIADEEEEDVKVNGFQFII